jgi:uncharacterized integral membrane protein
MAILWILLGAAAVVVGTLFAAQNPVSVDLTFFGAALYGVPLWLAIAVAALVGLVVGLLVGLPGRVRAGMAARRLNAQLHERDVTIGKLEQRVTELRGDVVAANRTAAAVPVATREVREVTEVESPRGDRGNLRAA